jgi:hypothetical protein
MPVQCFTDKHSQSDRLQHAAACSLVFTARRPFPLPTGLRNVQAKSRVTLRGNMKAARCVNHRGLPGGGGLWVCMRRPQHLYGPRGMSVRARALRCQQLFSLNCGFLPRSCCAFAHSTVLSVLGSLLSQLGKARHSSAAGQVQGGGPFWASLVPPHRALSSRRVMES